MRTTLRFDLQSNAFDHFATPPFFLNFFSAPLVPLRGAPMEDLCSSFGSQRGAPVALRRDEEHVMLNKLVPTSLGAVPPNIFLQSEPECVAFQFPWRCGSATELP